MVFAKSIIALAACILPFAFASPPAPTTCCTDGQGLIVQPGQGMTIQPGQMIPLQYTPRNGKTWASHNITVELVIAEGVGKSMTAKQVKNQVLARKADYTWGVYSSADPLPKGKKGPPANFLMPNLGFAPFNWGYVSDLQVYVTVLEKWTQYGTPDVLHKDVTYHWLTYNSNHNVQFQCSGTVDRADQSACECQFCSLGWYRVTDNSTKLFSDNVMDQSQCRRLCDSTKDCFSYAYNNMDSVNPDNSCILYSDPSPPAEFSTDEDSRSWVLGHADQACKAGCYQAS